MRTRLISYSIFSILATLLTPQTAHATAGGSDSTFVNIIVQAGPLTPAFSATTYSYSVSVPNTQTAWYTFPVFDVTSLFAGESATTTINGVSHNVTIQNDLFTQPLNVGANTVTIVGHSHDGTSNTTYTIIVTRAAGVPSSVSTLTTASTIKGQAVSSLGTPSSTLGGISSPGSVTITSAKAADTSGSGSFVTSFVKTDSGAMINKVVKYSSGASTTNFDSTDSAYSNAAISNNDFFIVKVTAADGTTVSYYKIVVTVPALASISTLTGLAVSSGTDALSPVFNAATNAYSTTVANTVDSVTVTATFTGTGESVQINSSAATSGVASGSLSLTVGTPLIVNILATAEDGSTTNYTLTITRAAAPTSSWIKGGAAGAGTRNWFGIASSTDGSHLAAVDANVGYIYTSIDSGVTWVAQTSAGARTWRSISSDSTGQYLNATDGSNGGSVYSSSDWGATWSVGLNAPTGSVSAPTWGIASSSDHTHLVATVHSGYIYTSTDSGANWDTKTAGATNNATGLGVQNWYGVASSSDGQKLVAANSDKGIYTSVNAGASWVQHILGSPSGHNWSAAASNADGTILAVADLGGYIWRSNDSGVSWVSITSLGSRSWWGISISANGSTFAASYRTTGPVAGGIYVSYTGGQGWTKISDGLLSWGQDFRYVALSGDGNKLFTAVPNGDLYVTTVPAITVPTINVTATSENATASSAITGLSITSTGGTIDNFTISPVIGNGLSFSTTTGAITGTPTSAAPAVTYTVTAWNGGGSASVTFTIEVAAGTPPPSGGSVTTPDPQQTSTVTPPPTQGSGSTGGGNNYVISGSFPTAITNISVADQSLPNTSWVQTSSSVAIIMPPHEEGTVLIQIYNGQVPLLAPIPYVYSKNVGASTPTPTPTPTPTNIGVFGFKTGSAAISKSAVKVLTRYAVGTKIIITGYAEPTDPKGDFKLSLKRAQSVKAQLLKLNPKLSVEVVAGGTSYNSACASARNKCVVIQKIG